ATKPSALLRSVYPDWPRRGISIYAVRANLDAAHRRVIGFLSFLLARNSVLAEERGPAHRSGRRRHHAVYKFATRPQVHIQLPFTSIPNSAEHYSLQRAGLRVIPGRFVCVQRSLPR